MMALLGANFLTIGPAYAQDEAGGGASDKDNSPLEAREAVGTILVSGLVGGILGLSTLSFYSKPQNHIRNITLGAAAGMLISIVYLTVNAATSPTLGAEDQTAKLPEAPRNMLVPNLDLSHPNDKKVEVAYQFRF